MDSNFYDAAKNFDENIRNYAPPEIEGEKYNLYAGLFNLARGLERVEKLLEEIRADLKQIRKY